MKLELPPRGALCEICKDYKKRCDGCIETEGNPWFLRRFTKLKVCPIYACVAKKKIEHCAECKEFPCKKFLDWYNPTIGFFRSALARTGSLFLRRKIGTERWKKLILKKGNLKYKC
jgi:hypothetical protein